MRIFSCVILFFIALSSDAAAPVASCSYTRTSGTAPLGVVVDCTGTTDADTSKPFHDLLYRHSFGDSSAGIWGNGANTNASKNVAIGPIAAHVYETAGTYTITTNITDGTSNVRTTQSITVSDPDTTYATTATVCFFNTAVGTGCPAGATQTASSDWDAAIASCMGTTKRCLFKRGDTFTASVYGTVSQAGPNTIGAYGSGALPIVTMAASNHCINLTNAAVNDLRIMDIDCVGGSAFDASQDGIHTDAATVSNVTMLRVTIRETGGQGIAINCTGCVIQDSTLSHHYGGFLTELICFSCAVLGNSIGPGGGGSYFGTFRATQAQKSVFAHNTITQAGTTVNQPVMRISGQVHVTTAEDTFYVVQSDNKIIQGLNGSILSTHMGNVGGDERLYDIITERNWYQFGIGFAGGGFDCRMQKTIGTRVTIRNNLFDMTTQCGDDIRGVNVQKDDASAPSPTDVNVYNNTFYAPNTYTTTITGVRLETNTTNAIVKNNLCWFDTGTTCLVDGGTGTVASNNSTDPQTTGTDPAFDTPLSTPSGFRISTGSYAATGGVALFPSSNSDFYDCDDTTSNEHMGAFVSRTRARCHSGAGP